MAIKNGAELVTGNSENFGVLGNNNKRKIINDDDTLVSNETKRKLLSSDDEVNGVLLNFGLNYEDSKVDLENREKSYLNSVGLESEMNLDVKVELYVEKVCSDDDECLPEINVSDSE
jgi:hypothetical protein